MVPLGRRRPATPCDGDFSLVCLRWKCGESNRRKWARLTGSRLHSYVDLLHLRKCRDQLVFRSSTSISTFLLYTDTDSTSTSSGAFGSKFTTTSARKLRWQYLSTL